MSFDADSARRLDDLLSATVRLELRIAKLESNPKGFSERPPNDALHHLIAAIYKECAATGQSWNDVTKRWKLDGLL